jgi:multidrug resistance efflux pump
MRLISYIKNHRFLSFIALFLVIFLAIFASRSSKEIVTNTDTQKRVTLVQASDFRNIKDYISATGVIQTKGQADLRSQISAPVKAVYAEIGDKINAGDIILELENSDIRAQLNQAQALLRSSEGQYRASAIGNEISKDSAIDKIRDSYVKGYDILVSGIDPLLYNYDGNGSQFANMVIDSKISSSILNTRLDLNEDLKNWKKTVDSLNQDSDSEEVQKAFALTQKNLKTIDRLLGDISQALNDLSRHASGSFSQFVTSWKTIISQSRTAMSATISTAIGAESAYRTANNNLDNVSIAQVNAGEASVNILEAQLAKTIISAPVGGKLASLPLSVGELASPGTLVASVVSDKGYEVKGYVSAQDLERIKVGNKVIINNGMIGQVYNVAPSVGGNKKAEIRISLDQATTTKKITIGSIVTFKVEVQKESSSEEVSYKLPIQDVKIMPGEAFVLSVDDNNKIIKNSVILGEVDGDYVQIISGLNDDMKIVTPVYELDEGEEVIVE